jgi:hypothetical protein
MPLEQSGSKGAQSRNISELVHAGHSQKQAVAISYDIKRKHDMTDAEKLDQIVSKTDSLSKRMDAFMARRRLRQDANRKKMADARMAMNQRKIDTQIDPGSLSKRNTETQ